MDPWVSDLSLLRKVDQRTNPVPLIASVELWPLQRHPYDLRVYEYRRSLFGLQGKTPGHELMSFRVTTFHLLSFFFCGAQQMDMAALLFPQPSVRYSMCSVGIVIPIVGKEGLRIIEEDGS